MLRTTCRDSTAQRCFLEWSAFSTLQRSCCWSALLHPSTRLRAISHRNSSTSGWERKLAVIFSSPRSLQGGCQDRASPGRLQGGTRLQVEAVSRRTVSVDGLVALFAQQPCLVEFLRQILLTLSDLRVLA